MSTARESTSRRFVLSRTEDVSGTSGIGVVAEGIEFSGERRLRYWLSQLESVEVCANMKGMVAIHGHEGRTVVVYLDPP